jgi:hypothetical protein
MPASNTSQNADQTVEEIFEDTPGISYGFSEVKFVESTTVPLTGSYKTPATELIGKEHSKSSDRERTGKIETNDVGTSVLDVVQMLGEGQTILDFDSNRQGKNVKNITHFSRMNLPLISINREKFDSKNSMVNHVAAFNLFGMPKLFKSYDEKKRVAIPFEDFPGRLDPVALVSAGNYILQYMIITDLTKDLDKFVNPDTLDGAIEVFEIRESFANTSISDIKIKGIKGSMSNENFYAIGQGAAPIDNKFEINQASNSVFEDCQDILYQDVNFSPREGYTLTGSFALESPVPDENRKMSPFEESKESLSIMFRDHLRSFLGSNYSGAIQSETTIPELGTRFRSSAAGFINSPNYVIMPSGSYIDPGTDSIAFSGLKRV